MATVRRGDAERRGLGDDERGCAQCDSVAVVRACAPAALGMAYNGGSVGGIILSPLWVAAISGCGFLPTVSMVAVVMVLTLWVLADRVFSRTPETMGLNVDGDEPGAPVTSVTSPAATPLPGVLLWRDRRFITLATGMMLGLFAQIGLITHLFSLLVPALGAQPAGLAMGLITVMAIAGRALLGWLMPPRRCFLQRRRWCNALRSVRFGGAPPLTLGFTRRYRCDRATIRAHASAVAAAGLRLRRR